mgnify:CR=1 FL=1
MNSNINRILYTGFIVLGVFTLLKADYTTAASYFGIGLAFDPFDPKQEWKQRPMWQRAWLIAHLAVSAGLLGLALGIDDRP